VTPLDRTDPDAQGPEPTQICDAFRVGIPDEIWWNRVDHRQGVDGDHGLQWQPLAKGIVFPDWAMNS